MQDLLPRQAQARLDLIEGVKGLVASRFTPALRQRYEEWAKGRAEAELRQRANVAARFAGDPAYQAGRGLARISQEAMWDTIRRGFEPDRAALEAELAAGPRGGKVTLALDPTLPLPRLLPAEGQRFWQNVADAQGQQRMVWVQRAFTGIPMGEAGPQPPAVLSGQDQQPLQPRREIGLARTDAVGADVADQPAPGQALAFMLVDIQHATDVRRVHGD